jgi:hypothetical protein
MEYHGDPAAALAACREQTFAQGDFFWYPEDDPRGAKPATLAELDVMGEREEFWEVGTHSILDVDRIIPSSDENRDGIRQLPAAEARELFGTATPTREQFEQVEDRVPYVRRWSGFYQLLYSDEKPTEIAFWGFSGD